MNEDNHLNYKLVDGIPVLCLNLSLTTELKVDLSKRFFSKNGCPLVDYKIN